MSGRAATTSVIPGRFAISVGRADMPTPPGWEWVLLTNIARLETGHTPSRKHPEYWDDGDIRWIGIKDARLHHGRSINDTIQKVTQLGIDNSASRLLPKGTVCLSRTASVGYVLVMGQDMATSQDFVNWVCSDALIPEFLMYALMAEGEGIRRFGKGTTHTTIYFPEVKALHACIPPTNEQRRIVAKIEELFSDLDAGVAALRRAKANLKRYRAAVLKAAVEGRLTDPEGDRTPFFIEKWQPLSDIVVSLEQGWSPKCERHNSNNPDEWVVMKTTAIQPLQYHEEENKKLPSSLTPREQLELQAGDLLITRAGPRSRAGVTCLVRQTRPRVILCDKAYRIRLNSSLVEPGYVEIILNSPPVLDVLNELKTGISDSGVNLTQKRFLQLQIPIPPLSVQRDTMEEVLRLISVAEVAEKEINSSMKRSTRLRQSILKRAFEGKLVHQDPSDEPAGVLLKKIKTEVGNASPSKPIARKRSRRP